MRSRGLVLVALCGPMLVGSYQLAPAHGRPRPSKTFQPHVVVATVDTGFNPFHPTWRRDQQRHPSRLIPGYPRDARPLRLRFDQDFARNVGASAKELTKLGNGSTYWIPGTNVIGVWASDRDKIPVFDPAAADDPAAEHTHDHGAGASSQIAGQGYGLAPDAFVVVVDRESDGSGERLEDVNARGVRWAADQPWIDIIHTNIQNPVPGWDSDLPGFNPDNIEAIRYALAQGKVVVAAGGNYWVEPTETSGHTGPPGVLVAGANDNCGYTDYSNPDPHVVMDGYGTVAAAPDGDGEISFNGTSSSSPRVAGYVAKLLLDLRRRFDYGGGIQDGALLRIPQDRVPSSGPLADGDLTAAELHEVVRKTASAQSHESQWDGAQDPRCIPAAPTPFSFYPKMGYGEVSEHTIDDALAVLSGEKAMPDRAVEDAYYEQSESLRRLIWSE